MHYLKSESLCLEIRLRVVARDLEMLKEGTVGLVKWPPAVVWAVNSEGMSLSESRAAVSLSTLVFLNFIAMLLPGPGLHYVACIRTSYRSVPARAVTPARDLLCDDARQENAPFPPAGHPPSGLHIASRVASAILPKFC